MALDVSSRARIRCDASTLATYAFDPANDPEWIGGIASAELLGLPPVRIGTRVRRTARFLGRTIHYVLEVREFVPERQLRMVTISGPFPMDVTYRVDPAGASESVFTIRVRGSASAFFGVGDILTAPLVKFNISGDVRRLRRIVKR